MLNHEAVKVLVEQELKALLLEANDEDVYFTMQDQLHGLDINSLLLARLIVQLDAQLGVQPFANGAVLGDVRTIGDLVTIYEHAQEQAQIA